MPAAGQNQPRAKQCASARHATKQVALVTQSQTKGQHSKKKTATRPANELGLFHGLLRRALRRRPMPARAADQPSPRCPGGWTSRPGRQPGGSSTVTVTSESAHLRCAISDSTGLVSSLIVAWGTVHLVTQATRSRFRIGQWADTIRVQIRGGERQAKAKNRQRGRAPAHPAKGRAPLSTRGKPLAAVRAPA